jgi:hypothetical protein
MSLRIAFDLDGTVADMHSALKAIEERLFGTGAGDAGQPTANGARQTDPAKTNAEDGGGAGESSLTAEMKKEGLTARQQRQLWRAVAAVENFWEAFEEIEGGAVRDISDHAARRRWEVIFLTRRPPTAGRTSQVQSQRWLAAHGFPLPTVYVVTGSRGKIADALALDAVIDDLPSNCLDVVTDSSARAILVRRSDSTRIVTNAKRLGITVVSSMAEALGALVDLEERRNRPKVGERLKRAVGIKSLK